MQMLSGAIVLLASSVCVAGAACSRNSDGTAIGAWGAAVLGVIGLITLLTGIAKQPQRAQRRQTNVPAPP
ncbi:MAG TPA: hypothetical protein VK395_22560 [Gemmataceae bacterium]|nr:hypothetical protein [Gemmataceae bacterium]